jgi:hypothetical protein
MLERKKFAGENVRKKERKKERKKRKKPRDRQKESRSGSVGRNKEKQEKMRYMYEEVTFKIVLYIGTEQGL